MPIYKNFARTALACIFFGSSFLTAVIPADWVEIQRNMKDTVVQVFSEFTLFNWREPYKPPMQSGGLGSGFFIGPDVMLTNYHVVQEANAIQIQVPSCGKERFDVELIGAAPTRDVALLRLTSPAKKKIETSLGAIPWLKFGDSDAVLRSQEVLAVGFPLGQEKLKSTLGIVSGRERFMGIGCIQISAPINHGNSGGPSLNHQGEVIGINTFGIQENGAQNIGYVIPSNEIKEILDDLYKVKLLRKPSLGCQLNSITEDTARYLGNPTSKGIYITKLFKGSPLLALGIQEGDVLIAINGLYIDNYGELDAPWAEDKISIFEFLDRCKRGDQITLTIYRQGVEKVFSYSLDCEYIEQIREMYPEFESQETNYEIIGGMVVMPLTLNYIKACMTAESGLQVASALTKYARPEAQQEPTIVIASIIPTSQADKTRVLTAGQIISKINGHDIQTLADVKHAIRNPQKEQPSFLTIQTTDCFAVLSIEKILQDEPRLSCTYGYEPTGLLKELLTTTKEQNLQKSYPSTGEEAAGAPAA